MGTLEKESAKRKRKNDLQEIILQTLAGVGFLSVAMFAPNILKAIDRLGLVPHGRQRETVIVARRRLVEKGLVRQENGKLFLTEKGKTVLQKLELLNYKIKKPKKWDGRWRVLIFDIPENRKGTREKVRRTLNAVGFKRLQDSVWLYPYPCDDLITLLKADFKIGKDLLYLIVDTLEYDLPHKKYFGLV